MDIQGKSNMSNNGCDWISVSEYAKRLGKSKQTVYNMVKANKLESKQFKRGSMIGLLIKCEKL
jgi:excisionase family DNA binding protein